MDVLKQFQKYPLQSGVLVGLLGAFLFVRVIASHVVIAVSLAAIAGIYIGFAINDGRARIILIEFLAGMAFIYLCVSVLDRSFLPPFLSIFSNRVLLAGGFAAHGIWDYIHLSDHVSRRSALIDTNVKGWYPVWCAWIDFVIAAAVYYY